jgi:hypothetical protein
MGRELRHDRHVEEEIARLNSKLLELRAQLDRGASR